MSLLRGTWCGTPVSIVAARVLSCTPTHEVRDDQPSGTEILLDVLNGRGENVRVYLSEPLEIVEAALCEALKYRPGN